MVQVRIADLERQVAQQQCIVALLEQRLRRLEGNPAISGRTALPIELAEAPLNTLDCAVQPPGNDGDYCAADAHSSALTISALGKGLSDSQAKHDRPASLMCLTPEC